jgi:predicted RNA-binding Zn ribbon-like protein
MFRALMADHPFLAGPVTRHDLESLRLLRAEFAAIFAAAAAGAPQAAAERLNALLICHPIHPEMTSHDGADWHLHLAPTGSAADRCAAGAVIGLALFASQFGMKRLGVCAIASCSRVFLDASTNRSRRYCAEHSPARTNVTAIAPQMRAGSDGSAATAAS